MPTTATLFFDLLRQMDLTAGTVDGHVSGLRSYYRWKCPESCRNDRTEEAWTEALAAHLSDRGIVAFHRVAYPARVRRAAGSGRSTCDLVIVDPTAGPLWIEVKGAWQYLCSHGRMLPNPHYRGHLLERTTADVVKVSALRPPEANAVAVLLVGFDSEDTPMDADVSAMLAAAGAATAGKLIVCPPWPDRTSGQQGNRVRCWWWSRSVRAVGL